MMSMRMFSAAFAVYPPGIAVRVVFFFPNRYAVFYFIDDVATGFKCFVAMPAAHADPHGDVADR